MKTIGFIDYFLDEWHANKYPEWIEQASGGQLKVTYAYAMIDSPSGLDNATWCRNKGIELLESIEEVVAKSDYLIVLSPDYPEFHEQLAMLPLQSGKPTYVDKTFAPDRKTAQLLFDTAAAHNTPLYSSSALRFAAEYTSVERQAIHAIQSIGPGRFENYSIHQIEPIVSLMGSDAVRVMSLGTNQSPALLIEFTDGRQATVRHFSGDAPFSLAIEYDSKNSAIVKVASNFFALFIDNLLQFFESGQPTVHSDETIAVITIIEYGLIAMQTPYTWIELP